MSREIGVSKLIVKCLFSPAPAKQNDLVGLYKKDYQSGSSSRWGFSKLIARYIFSPILGKQNELVELYKRDY